jgi:hypothetical protein
LAGHAHHFERTYLVRGVLPGADLLIPASRGSSFRDTACQVRNTE